MFQTILKIQSFFLESGQRIFLNLISSCLFLAVTYASVQVETQIFNIFTLLFWYTSGQVSLLSAKVMCLDFLVLTTMFHSESQSWSQSSCFCRIEEVLEGRQ